MAQKYAHYDTEGNIQGFYIEGLHEVIPIPNISITEEEWLKCLRQMGMYKILNGVLTFVPPKPLSKEQIVERKKAAIRYEREKLKLFEETRWIKERHEEEIILGIPTSLSDNQYRELLQYRQALRDSTEQLELPTKPNFLN